MFVINKAKIKTLITTMDLEFSRFSPNADRIIYTEHIQEAIERGLKPHVYCESIDKYGSQLKSLIDSGSLEAPVTIIFERTKGDELKCTSLSHRNLLSVLHGLRQVYYFEKGSRMMSNLPFYQSYGFVVEFLLPLIYDLKLECTPDKISSTEFLQRMMESKPSLVIATPNQLNSIAELSQVKNIPFLTHIFTADTRPDHHSIETLGNRGIEVFVCAGMNDTSSVFAINLHNYQGKDIVGKIMVQENNEENSIGKPLPGVAVKVCNDQLQELDAHEFGTIWVKGACVSNSSESRKNCRPTLSDGWYNTGIRGSINPKGFIQIQPKTTNPAQSFAVETSLTK
jgi:acyl-CoA synthetase (AMP-forming)/AMP-acid ligase II